MPAALGVSDASGEKVWASAADTVQRFSVDPHLAPPVVALAVAALMLLGARWRPRVPFSLIGVVLATAAARALELDVTTLGRLPSRLPAPSIAFIDPPR